MGVIIVGLASLAYFYFTFWFAAMGLFLIVGDESLWFQIKYGGITAWIAILIYFTAVGFLVYGYIWGIGEVLSGWN